MGQIGTVKVETPSGIKSLPVFSEGGSGSSVHEMLKVETPSGIGYIPLVENSGDATFDYIKVQTANHGIVHVHDAESLGYNPPVTPAHGFDATQISGSDGDAIGTWTNQEGGTDLTIPTSSEKPTLKTGIMNGKQVLSYDGSDDNLDGDFTDHSQNFHIFFAGEFKSHADTNRNTIYDSNESTNRVQIGNQDDEWFMYAGNNQVTGGTVDNNAHVITAMFGGASSYLRVDGSQVLSGSAGSASFDTFTVGSEYNESMHADVYIGEVLIYSSELSDSDRNSVESYLDDKWLGGAF